MSKIGQCLRKFWTHFIVGPVSRPDSFYYPIPTYTYSKAEFEDIANIQITDVINIVDAQYEQEKFYNYLLSPEYFEILKTRFTQIRKK